MSPAARQLAGAPECLLFIAGEKWGAGLPREGTAPDEACPHPPHRPRPLRCSALSTVVLSSPPQVTEPPSPQVHLLALRGCVLGSPAVGLPPPEVAGNSGRGTGSQVAAGERLRVPQRPEWAVGHVQGHVVWLEEGSVRSGGHGVIVRLLPSAGSSATEPRFSDPCGAGSSHLCHTYAWLSLSPEGL